MEPRDLEWAKDGLKINRDPILGLLARCLRIGLRSEEKADWTRWYQGRIKVDGFHLEFAVVRAPGR